MGYNPWDWESSDLAEQLSTQVQNPYVEVLTLVLENVTVFGDRTFKEVIKMRSCGWA